MKIPVVNREYYVVYIEYFNEMHWIHTDVFKWSAEIKKQYIKDLNQLQSLIDCKMYGAVEQDNTKLSKFGESIGFNYLQDLQGNDGNVYKIYTRSL